MEYIPGHVYFVKDEFFDLVQDPYLMKIFRSEAPTLLCDSGSQDGTFLDDSMYLKGGQIQADHCAAEKKRSRCDDDPNRNDCWQAVSAASAGYVSDLREMI